MVTAKVEFSKYGINILRVVKFMLKMYVIYGKTKRREMDMSWHGRVCKKNSQQSYDVTSIFQDGGRDVTSLLPILLSVTSLD